MKYFNWKKIYEIGIPDVDKQHRMIFDIVNTFYAELFSENFMKDNKPVFNILLELRDYCDFHFKYEKYLYSKKIVDEYFGGNDEIITRINKLFKNDVIINIIDVYVFAEYLRKWVVKHILLLNDNSFKDILKKDMANAY